MSYPANEEYIAEKGEKKFAITTLGARIAGILAFIVTLAVLQTNDLKSDNYTILTYKNFRSYKYGFWIGVIGLAYTVMQVPFAIHYMLRKKHLINSYNFLRFDFYADKTVALVVATAAGAMFGATADLKNIYPSNDADEVQNFLSITYIAAAFLLVAAIAAWISSIHSSLALSRKLTQQF